MRGELLAERFRIGGRLGAGGMGEVWAAQDERMRRDVAVKLVHAFGAHEEETRARFGREVQLAGRLSHQNIVTVHDWGEERIGSRAVFYLVMELVYGVPLGSRLKEGPPSWPLAVGWALQIAQALDAAHRRGVVHRDIKPSNVLLTPEGTAKVLDFGVAKFIGETMSVHELTVTGALLGSPPYMSPEQAEGLRDIDHRSDLYSLGCLLYHALTGRPPFVGDSPLALLRAHVEKAPVAPAEIAQGLPESLSGLVLALLAKDPGDRPDDAATVHEALSGVLMEETLGLGGSEVLLASELGKADSVAGRFVGRARDLLRRAEEDVVAAKARVDEWFREAQAITESAKAEAEGILSEARREASREGEQAARDIDAVRSEARREADRLRAAAAEETVAVIDKARADAERILREARLQALTVAERAKQAADEARVAAAHESVARINKLHAELGFVPREARRGTPAAGDSAAEGSGAVRPTPGEARLPITRTKKVLTYLGLIPDDEYDYDRDLRPEPDDVAGPAVEHATDTKAFSPFWMAVPVPRPLMPEDGGAQIVAELATGTWYLAVESRGSGLVVQTQDGRRGVLEDITGIQRG